MAIFKYFTMESHARGFINKGIMLLRPLSYFRAYEDGQTRGYPHEGLLTYAPPAGLEITKQDGTVLTLEGYRFTSAAKHDDIFVYCASNQLSSELAERFESPFCVEIKDTDRIVNRLRARAHPTSQLDYENLVCETVNHRNHEREPGVDWALPERLAFMKPESFAWQDEFRIAIGKRGAFDVQNVDCKLEQGTGASAGIAPTQAELILRIGKMDDFTCLHRL